MYLKRNGFASISIGADTPVVEEAVLIREERKKEAWK